MSHLAHLSFGQTSSSGCPYRIAVAPAKKKPSQQQRPYVYHIEPNRIEPGNHSHFHNHTSICHQPRRSIDPNHPSSILQPRDRRTTSRLPIPLLKGSRPRHGTPPYCAVYHYGVSAAGLNQDPPGYRLVPSSSLLRAFPFFHSPHSPKCRTVVSSLSKE